MSNQRLNVLYKISSISDTYCNPCGDKGNIATVCIKCPHGIELKDLGNQLNQMKRERIRVSKLKANKEVLSKLTYINMTNRGMNKAAIAKHFGISPSALSYHINKWDKEGLEKEVAPSVATKNNQNKKAVSQDNKNQEYQNLMNELSGKLKTSEADVKELEEKIKQYQNIADFSHQEKEKAQKEALKAKGDYETLHESYEKLKKDIEIREAEVNDLEQKYKGLAEEYDKHAKHSDMQYQHLESEKNQLLAQIEKLYAENEELKNMAWLEPAPVGVDTEQLAQEVARLSHENNLFKQTLKIVL